MLLHSICSHWHYRDSSTSSRRNDAEAEKASRLSTLDNELAQTEDALTKWSHQSSTLPSHRSVSGSASFSSFKSTAVRCSTSTSYYVLRLGSGGAYNSKFNDD